MRPVSLLLLLLFVAPLASAVDARNYDVVTLRNGDIHLGTLARESFPLDTPYGPIAVPQHLMAVLEADPRDPAVVHLRTWEGERFSGRLPAQSLTLLRGLEATLTVAPQDLLRVEFARRPFRARLEPVTDVIEMHNGDRFRGRVTSRALELRDGAGDHALERRELFLLDLEPGPEGVRARVERNGNAAPLLGVLLTESLTVRVRFGTELRLPAVDLAGLAFGVVHRPPQYGGDLDTGFRQRLPVAALLRDRLRDGSSGPVLLALRGGPFRRGDLTGGGDGDETPARELILRPFAIGVFELTFEEYDRFCSATGRGCPDDQGWGRGSRPVVNVSWDDAHAYLDWLSAQTGERYRLPTDAEWEYAARAGSETRYPWGDELGADRANCSGCGSLWDGERTAPVGRFAPNGFGLHDMAGNVFEWAEDCWNTSYAEAPADGTALETVGCGKRVIRGGGWSFPPNEVRSANRWRDFPSRSSDDTGFRVVRELAP